MPAYVKSNLFQIIITTYQRQIENGISSLLNVCMFGEEIP